MTQINCLILKYFEQNISDFAYFSTMITAICNVKIIRKTEKYILLSNIDFIYLIYKSLKSACLHFIICKNIINNFCLYLITH